MHSHKSSGSDSIPGSMERRKNVSRIEGKYVYPIKKKSRQNVPTSPIRASHKFYVNY